MAEHRLKIKIGDHEFEAEGPADIVQSQFAAFKELVTSAGLEKKSIQSTFDTTPPSIIIPKPDEKPNTNNLPYEKIMRHDARLVSLTVHAQSLQDAILALLLGQRHFRSNDSVTGSEILDGLRESGRGVDRVDHTLSQLATEGSVIVVGQHRAKRYRLTNAGMNKAQEIVRSLIALVP